MKKELSSKKVLSLTISPLQNLGLEELLSYKAITSFIRNETPGAISQAISTNKEFATVLEINNSGYFIEIPYRFWRNALNACLATAIEEEDYSECAEIQKVIERLNEYEKIPTTIKTLARKKGRRHES